jgi:hypothetical protein
MNTECSARSNLEFETASPRGDLTSPIGSPNAAVRQDIQHYLQVIGEKGIENSFAD